MVPCWEFFLSFFGGVDFLFFPFPFLLPPLSFMMSSAFGSLLYSAWHGASTFRLKKSIISFHFHASAITTGALLTHYYTTKPGYSNSFMSENIQTQQVSCRHLAVPFTESTSSSFGPTKWLKSRGNQNPCLPFMFICFSDAGCNSWLSLWRHANHSGSIYT